MKAGWEVKPLGDVVSFHYGKPLAREDRKPDGRYPVYGANGIKARSDREFYDRPSIIVGRKGSAGEVTRAEVPFWPLDVTYFTSHNADCLDFDFLHYLLLTLDLPKLARGVKPGINRNDVYALPIPLPPLEEQRRIVAVLDEAFEGLNRARENTETNLTNARELFEGAVGSYFNSDDFTAYELGDLANLAYGYTTSAKHDGGGPKFLRITDIQEGFVDWETVPFCETAPEKLDKYALKQGDIVFARTGATTGKSYLIDQEVNAVAASYLIRLRITNSSLLPHFLYFYFQSDRYWQIVREGMSGSAQGGFNASKLSTLSVPLPNENVQGEIADRLLQLEDQTTRMAMDYETKLTDLEDLRQSLLQKAFAGELT